MPSTKEQPRTPGRRQEDFVRVEEVKVVRETMEAPKRHGATDRAVGAGLGGAMLGGALGGPIGAVAGVLLGALIGSTQPRTKATA